MNSHYINNILRYIFICFRFLFVIFLFALMCLLFYFATKWAYPFIIALIIAFFINPVVNLLERRARFPRGLATFTVIIIISALLIGLIIFIVSEMIDGIQYLTNVVPKHVQNLFNLIQDFFFTEIIPLYEQLTNLLNSLKPSQQQTIQENIKDLGSEVADTLANWGTGLVQFLQNFIASLPTLLTVSIFVLLATFFICKDWYKIGAYLKQKFPERWVESGGKVYLDLRKAFLGFIRAQLTLISITAVIVLIGLLILGVDQPVTIAIITGIVDLLPYLGTGAVFVPWIIYSFFTDSLFITIGLAVLYAVVVIQRQMMEPKILSSSIGLDPLPTLIALFVGFQLFGFLGLIIGPTAIVIFNTLAQANVFKDIWDYIIGNRTMPK